MDHRYKKRLERYWKKMLNQGINSLSDLDVHGWFDYWHAHPDWLGKGNRFPENRLRAAEIGYELLCYAEKLTNFRGSSIQCWLTICENTCDNAVFLHSENPNGSVFPYDFDNCQWGLPEIPGVDFRVDFLVHEIGVFQYQDQSVYVVKSKA